MRTQHTGLSPADYDVEFDEEQRVRRAAVLLVLCAREVRRAVPWLSAEEHQDLCGEQGHLWARLLQPEKFGKDDMGGDEGRVAVKKQKKNKNSHREL